MNGKTIKFAVALAATALAGWQTTVAAQEGPPPQGPPQGIRPQGQGRIGGMPSAPKAPATKTAQTYYMFVLNQPKPGREAEFNRWYDQQHAQDVLINPEYLESQRFIVNEQQLRPGTPPPAQYIIGFKVVTKDISGAFQYIHNNLQSGKTVSTDTILNGTGMGGDFTYHAVTPLRAGRAATKRVPRDLNQRYMLLEFSTVPAGQEDAYGRWHDKVHAPKVAALPQVRGWQRFEYSAGQLTGNKLKIAAPHMTMYMLDIATPADFDQLKGRMDALAASETNRPGALESSVTYRAIGPVLLDTDVKRERGLIR